MRAFSTTSEVSASLQVQPHILRFWASRFREIQPLRKGSRSFYRYEDIALLRGIQHLLYVEHISIRGVQKILREKGLEHVRSLAQAQAA